MAISNNNEPNVRSLRRLLEGLGLRLNCRFLGDARCEELRGFLKAPLNILDSESADNLELKGFLEKTFGCRFLPGRLPVGLEQTEEELDLDYCKEAYQGDVRYALSNSLGFGGHNASVLLKKYEG